MSILSARTLWSEFDSGPGHGENDAMPIVYYSTAEAAEYLKVTPGRILDLIDEGRFPGAVKINNKWQIPAEEVIGFKPMKSGRPKKRPGRPRKTRTQKGIDRN